MLELAFVAGLRAAANADELRRIHDFLKDHPERRPIVPVKERSFQLFGDEKRLDALRKTKLFEAGRLTLVLLRCARRACRACPARGPAAASGLSSKMNRTFAALADPTRRRILEHLARGDRCVTDLAKPHPMSLPAVSKHLRVLENAGLIRRKRYGRVHELKLEAFPMKKAAQWIEEYRRFWEGSLDRLADYLETANERAGKKGKA